jgi:hypothetical protein
VTLRAIVVMLLLAISGCASSPVVLLNAPPAHTMADDDLLAYYIRLRNYLGESDQAIYGMQSRYGYDRVYGGTQGAAGNIIVQAMIAGTASQIRERAVLVRVELERRGWTPALGFTRGMTQAGGGFPVEQPLPHLAQAAPPLPVAYGAAPAMSPGINMESKWLVSAEGVAKAGGCVPPSAAMTSKGAGFELFAVGCPNGTTLAIRCEVDGCRVLR